MKGFSSEKNFKKIKPKDALKHPKWKMGNKISVDSSTLMNKIFEIAEAEKLFNINNKKLEILIHPESLVHAIIEFENGLKKFLYHETSMIIPLANAIFDEKLKIKDYGDKVTFHDPCYLGRIGGETEAPREAIGGDLIEMERSREKSFCCGGGGARIWMEEDADKRVNEIRAKEAVNTGADCVAVGCPFCMTMMSDGLKTLGEEQRTVKDISEIMLENLEG